jgi:hypothetical protein
MSPQLIAASPLSSAEYRALKARAARSRMSKMARVRRLAAAAGIDPGMPFMHASNAMCGVEHGRPWPNVDYSKVRLVLRLERDVFAADHIVDRLASRRGVSHGR